MSGLVGRRSFSAVGDCHWSVRAIGLAPAYRGNRDVNHCSWRLTTRRASCMFFRLFKHRLSSKSGVSIGERTRRGQSEDRYRLAGLVGRSCCWTLGQGRKTEREWSWQHDVVGNVRPLHHIRPSPRSHIIRSRDAHQGNACRVRSTLLQKTPRLRT